MVYLYAELSCYDNSIRVFFMTATMYIENDDGIVLRLNPSFCR